MNKQELIGRVRTLLEERECPSEELEAGQPGLKWFIPLSEEYERDYAIGELFFSSDLAQQEMEEVDLIQINIVFHRNLERECVDNIRAYFSKVNRAISGGRFDAQEADICFAEYGHDLIVDLEASDDRTMKIVTMALDLAEAYIGFAYDAVCGLADGSLTIDQALEMTFQQ